MEPFNSHHPAANPRRLHPESSKLLSIPKRPPSTHWLSPTVLEEHINVLWKLFPATWWKAISSFLLEAWGKYPGPNCLKAQFTRKRPTKSASCRTTLTQHTEASLELSLARGNHTPHGTDATIRWRAAVQNSHQTTRLCAKSLYSLDTDVAHFIWYFDAWNWKNSTVRWKRGGIDKTTTSYKNWIHIG